ISAFHVMRRTGTTVRPDRGTDHLVMEGPFSFTRNPLYLAGTTLVGDWTDLWDRVVFAACRPRCLRGAKTRHREGGKASPCAIREDLSGLRRACAAVDLGLCVYHFASFEVVK